MNIVHEVVENQIEAHHIAQVLEDHKCSVFSILYDPESIYRYSVWAKYDPDVITHDEIFNALHPFSF